MSRYFFILGRHQALSLAEINLYFVRENIVYNPLYLGPDFLLWETENKVDLTLLNERLGGVVKAGEIWAERPKRPNLLADIKEALNDQAVRQFLPSAPDKYFLGFSLYPSDRQNFSFWKKDLEKHFLTLKKGFKEKGQKFRFVTSREPTLSSVVVSKNKLLTAGAEITIFITEEKIYIGKTVTVQNFASYSFRDYGRPGRDMDVGLMPPKLARILVNLAQVKESAVILDPFVGCGTVLAEALLMGYKNLIGSDINLNALNQARRNLDWLCQNYKIDPLKIQVKLFSFDVRDLGKNFEPYSVDAVATEPYLGPPLSVRLSEGKIKMITANIGQLYLDFFSGLKKVLKPGGRLVMIWPVFRGPTGLYSLPILEKVLEKGWQKIDVIPAGFKNYKFKELTPRGSILYSREDQRVLREIFVFKNL